jgi:hypothetical protein
MPRGPKGEKRPGDVIGAAIMVGRIATGEIEEPTGKAPNRAKGGKKGAKARARILSPKSGLRSLGQPLRPDGRRGRTSGKLRKGETFGSRCGRGAA